MFLCGNFTNSKQRYYFELHITYTFVVIYSAVLQLSWTRPLLGGRTCATASHLREWEGGVYQLRLTHWSPPGAADSAWWKHHHRQADPEPPETNRCHLEQPLQEATWNSRQGVPTSLVCPSPMHPSPLSPSSKYSYVCVICRVT